MPNVLVIECESHQNWYEVFDGTTFNGEPVRIEQAPVTDISVVTYEDGRAQVTIRAQRNPHPGTSQTQQRTFRPDFVLVRSIMHGIHGQDSRNQLYALMIAGIPAVNSLEAVYACQERPVVFGALRQIQRRLGNEAFPLIPQAFYPSHRAMLITPELPIVCKMGHTHAGYGKMRFFDSDTLEDFKGVVACHGDYVTAEPFIEWDYDLRVQKIGDTYRAFKRRSPKWKGNVGNMSILEDVPMEDHWKVWVDEASAVFGGLDICAIDALHSAETGAEYILELNDTAIGLVHHHAAEDRLIMRDLVMRRMHAHLDGPLNNARLSSTPEEQLMRQLIDTRVALERLQNDVGEALHDVPTNSEITPRLRMHALRLHRLAEERKAGATRAAVAKNPRLRKPRRPKLSFAYLLTVLTITLLILFGRWYALNNWYPDANTSHTDL